MQRYPDLLKTVDEVDSQLQYLLILLKYSEAVHELSGSGVDSGALKCIDL